MTQAKPSVVLIEDDDAVREAMVSLLGSSGAAVVSYSSAEQFLRTPSHDGIGCLIFDVNLPGMSGLDLFRELPATRWCGIPVILITARADPEGRMGERAMRGGAHAFLCKPLLDDALLAAVHSALRR
jgi:FixJ family two-component response regulator